MKNRTRFNNALNFKPVDRVPCVEWASWWDKTIDRWKQEGLPEGLNDGTEIMEYFGLDPIRQWWLSPLKPLFHERIKIPGGTIKSMDDYIALREQLFPDPKGEDLAELYEGVHPWAGRQEKGDAVLWITLHGFFWFPRDLFGIEEHLYAFYDHAEIMHKMNQDLLEYNLRVLDAFCKICVPDFMTFAEDMSYNHGPMLSKPLFDEFIAPYYKQIVPRLKEYGITPIIDTDGNLEPMIPWFDEVGVEGFLPLERQAGVDINRIRENHPRLRIIGAFDKMVMNKGEEAMREEFERILPVMKQGGYIPSVDHQTPPGVSLENYRIYVRLLKEYGTM